MIITRSLLLRFLPLLVLIAGLGLFFVFGWQRFFTIDTLKANHIQLTALIAANHILMFFVAIGLYTIVVAMSIPGALVLSIASGLLFGLWWGTAAVVLGATLGASVIFLAVKLGFGQSLTQQAGKTVATMEAGFKKNAWSYLLMLRLIPLFPFWLVNIVPALLGVATTTFIITTAIGIIPGSFVFVSIGNGASAVFTAGQALDLAIFTKPAIILPLVGLALLSAIPILYKIYSKTKPPTAAAAETPTPITADICIIGAGAAGLSLAAGAAQMGANIVLLERAKMGGDCLNHGCVPSKALLAASQLAHRHPHPEDFGVKTTTSVDMAAVSKHIAGVIAAIAPHDSVERFRELGVKVIEAAGTFVDARTVATTHHIIHARYFVIATGSSPLVPPIQGLAATPYFTNETIFANTTLPEHLLVLGGGPIGVEIAQAYAHLGAKVTIISALPILNRDDADCVEILRGALTSCGIDIIENINIDKISGDANTVSIHYSAADSQHQLSGSHILVAAGRVANTQHLGLAAAGIAHTDQGVCVDARLRTNYKHIYAIGDVTGQHQFTHVASYHAGIVIRNILFKLRAKVQTHAIPWVTYTSPEMAHVGLTEAETNAQFADVKVLRWSFADNDRARTERLSGLVKIYVRNNGQILGADIVAPHAGEIIQPWILAINSKLKIGAMAAYISPYPTWSEVNKRVAGTFYTKKLFSKRVRIIVRFLLKLPF